jgi:exosome complex component MTR3
VICSRWPKSGAEVIVTVLEGAEERLGDVNTWTETSFGEGPFARMVLLAGCISVAGAALACAGIDAVDLVSGGVAALVRSPDSSGDKQRPYDALVDPDFAEHEPKSVMAACCVAYLRSRDEIAGLWTIGDIPLSQSGSEKQPATQGEAWEQLLDSAVRAASLSGQVVRAAVMGEDG